MQLPRGTFDRFVRDETVLVIIKELGDVGYSGSCSGIFGDFAGELIFENGKIILAKSPEKTGGEALVAIHSDSGGKVAAELLVYNEAELKLAREFNPTYVVPGEALDSLFSGARDAGKPVGRTGTKNKDNDSGPKTDLKSAAVEEGEEFLLDESEIQSIASSFRSGVQGLLKKINLDHLVVVDDYPGDNNSQEDNK